jgi:hypothetical protein
VVVRLDGPSRRIFAEPLAVTTTREQVPAPVTESPPREPVADAAPAGP